MRKKSILRFRCEVSDYEHCGDLENQVREIKSLCPEACNFKTYEEEDYEAESDYKEDYGEEDFESIYKGFVEFDAPTSCESKLEDLDCYVIR